MPKKFIPYYPDTIQGQAILNNITRTKRILKYRDSDKVYERIKRGLPLYDVDTIEQVRKSPSSQEGDLEVVKNLVIRGECISACAYLKQKGIKVDLVYIDPPFASGADYAKKVFIRRNPQLAEEIKKAEETLDIDELRSFEEKMYGDVWNKEDYLNWMYENLVAIKSVMSETASIYVHIDWHIGHYIKILLDEVFGEDNFNNEIIWAYRRWTAKSKTFQNSHDIIYWYSKTENYIWNQIFEDYADAEAHFTEEDDNGKYRWQYLRGEKYKLYLREGIRMKDWWDDISYINSMATERLDYSTQKPEEVLKRVITASSNELGNDITKEKMIIADFFGGSGVTAKAANDLGRNFIHVDIGINSIQTTRDRLKAAGAEFDVLEVKDGVNLFRNPIQTMDKLASLIPGLQKNNKYNTAVIPNESEESLSKFWFGSISDSKLGQVPVYVPNLLDHNQKVLDIPIINEILSQELPKLENIKKVIAYYIDLSDEKTIKKFIEENNATEIEVELRDLKQVLDEVVVTDQVEYTIQEFPSPSQGEGQGVRYEVIITKFTSDRLIQKIDEYNQKKELASTKTKLFEELENENGDSEEFEDTENSNGNSIKKPYKKIEISANGLELIELVSLDCANAEGEWNSTTEIKIDKYGYVSKDGTKTKTFWDTKIQSTEKPVRMKIRNIAGDELIISFNQEMQVLSNKKVPTTKKKKETESSSPKGKRKSK